MSAHTDSPDPFAGADCPLSVELAALLDGEVSENRATAVRAHLPGCQRCRARFARLQASAAALPAALGEPRDADFLGDVMRRIEAAGTPRPARRRWTSWLGGGVAVAAVMAAAVVAIQPGGPPQTTPAPEFTARGSGTVPEAATRSSLEVFSGPHGETPLKDAARVDATHGFRFRISNYGPDRQFMLLGVDARGDVHWFYPGWTNARARPTSLPIAAGAHQLALKEGVTPVAPAPGAFEVVALFMDSPVDVVTIEQLISRHGLNGALKRPPPIGEMVRLSLKHVPATSSKPPEN